MPKSYRFVNLDRPLEYAVYCGKKLVIPAGATGVKIAFRQSHLYRLDPDTGRRIKLNVYLWRGRLYHA